MILAYKPKRFYMHSYMHKYILACMHCAYMAAKTMHAHMGAQSMHMWQVQMTDAETEGGKGKVTDIFENWMKTS
jgi:hypothetical protein